MCKLPLIDELMENIYFNFNKLEIHHINSISKAFRKSNKYDKQADYTSNLQLLHTECHYEITKQLNRIDLA